MKLNLPPLEEDDDIDITPMIDCVFLLVLFFMVTSSFIDEPRMEPVPYTITVPGDDEKIFTLSVEGTYLLRDGDSEEEFASLAELAERIRQEPGKKYRVETRANVQSVSDDKKEDVQVVPLNLPRAERPTTIRRDEADQLTIPRDGPLRFKDADGERTFGNARELLEGLNKRLGEARKRPVILRTDAKCEYQRVLQARNALRLVGVELFLEEVEARNGNP